MTLAHFGQTIAGEGDPLNAEGPISITVKYINKLIFILSVCFVI